MTTALLFLVLHASPAQAPAAADARKDASAVVAAAFPARPSSEAGAKRAEVPSSAGSERVLWVPAVGLLLLAGAALFFTRAKKRSNRLLHVLESASLGPKRSVVVLRLANQVLLVGASESGLTLLAHGPATAEAHSIGDAKAAGLAVARAPGPSAAPPGVAASGVAAPAFDALLQEAGEDQDLRAKLAAGLRSIVQ